MSLSKAIGVISGINECANLFQWASSAISSLQFRWNGTQQQTLQNEILQLQNGLQRLKDTLPSIYDLIDQAEWKSHKRCVADLLAKLKDAVYDADDLLDEFRWYELKVEKEGNGSENPFIDFYDSVIQGSCNKINDIHGRLNNISNQLEKMGLRAHEGIQRFDKSVRPETSSFPDETNIFGRDRELKKVIGLLGVPANGSTAISKRKRGSTAVNASSSNQHNNESRMPVVPVLPIVGIGGVGKTTLAQHICNHPQVKSHFDLIIWICVSDDFDVKRLTKDASEYSSGKKATSDHLDSLQRALSNNVSDRRFLIILDDMWDDALKDNMQCWKRFCAPLKNVVPGSMMLVTTRSPLVADGVRTMESFTLDGLNDDVFWNFFKLCVFGSQGSNNQPELELIGKSIVPKLKGSPLAAKTLGRLLRKNLEATHWKNILESELWELKQDETDILPALRLSYMYLPYHLKRCFSFCAVYPKDHKFEKCGLAETWVAEGFVEHEGDIPIMDIASLYFEDLVNRSFFQKVRAVYLIHDLMHDMAQLVSKHDCFIIKDKSDFEKVPVGVRHLSILPTTDLDCNSLLILCKHRKLRTLLCDRYLRNKNALSSAMDPLCSELQHMRVICCAITEELPESTGNLKHLRYVKLSGASPFKSLPSYFCCLYNLQFFSAKRCKLESLPSGFVKLSNLQRFEIQDFNYTPNCSLCILAGQHLALINNMNQFYGDLEITGLDAVTKDLAEDAALNKKKYIGALSLQWGPWRSQEHNEIEVLQVLRPPTNTLKILELNNYPGESLPSWFQPRDLPSLSSIKFFVCYGLKSMSVMPSLDLNETPAGNVVENSSGCIGCFSSLTDLTIYGCNNLSSIDSFLQPAYVPAIRTMLISECRKLVSLATGRSVEFCCLEELTVNDCQSINNSHSLSMPALNKLVLRNSGNLVGNIVSRSCNSLTFSCRRVQSIPLRTFQVLSTNLPGLQKLELVSCSSLERIEESEPTVSTTPSLRLQEAQGRSGRTSIRIFSCLTDLTIRGCCRLSTLDDLLSIEYISSIERICMEYCDGLHTLPGERFGSFAFLKDLEIRSCPFLGWQRGLVLPSSLQRLSLSNCGNMSGCFPTCLENLNSLVSLNFETCSGVVCIPGHLWTSNLTSLQKLFIFGCPDLVSIGGQKAIEKVKEVSIIRCPKLKEPKLPFSRSGRNKT